MPTRWSQGLSEPCQASDAGVVIPHTNEAGMWTGPGAVSGFWSAAGTVRAGGDGSGCSRLDVVNVIYGGDMLRGQHPMMVPGWLGLASSPRWSSAQTGSNHQVARLGQRTATPVSGVPHHWRCPMMSTAHLGSRQPVTGRPEHYCWTLASDTRISISRRLGGPVPAASSALSAAGWMGLC